VDFSKFGAVETKPLGRIEKISGPHLHRSWLNVPHVTHTDEADITEIEAFRKELDDAGKGDKKPYRVSLLPFLMKASVVALRAHPTFNASLTPQRMRWSTRLLSRQHRGRHAGRSCRSVVRDVDLGHCRDQSRTRRSLGQGP
jgi:hypothetical protein